jgi:Protein of unknown function (DUF4238)
MEEDRAATVAKTGSGKKAKDPRKHHYVPVFYQSNFTNEAGLLWVYDRERGTYKELHPRVVCFEKDLYAVKPENKPRDMQVELKVLGLVDSLGFRGIRDFQIGKPNSEAEQEVAFFMAFQWNRVPTISRDIRTTYAKAIEELGRITFANVERAKAVMEKYERDTGETLEVTPESMVESVQGKQFDIVATETAFVATMMEQAMSLTRVLLRLDWEVLVACEETGFIICDCPVAVVPPRGSDQVGFLVPGSAKYFPLSRHLCLRLGELGKSRKHRKIDKEAVRIVNQNIAANSERFIMGPSRVQLENIVLRSGSAKMESTPRFTIETVESDEDGALQKISAQPRRYFYPKNGAPCAP